MNTITSFITNPILAFAKVLFGSSGGSAQAPVSDEMGWGNVTVDIVGWGDGDEIGWGNN